MMRNRTSAITCVLLFAVGAADAADTGTIDGADSGWRAVSECASQPNEKARHACLDDVLRRAGLLTAERETRQQRERFGLKREVPAPASSAAVTPTPSTPASAPASTPDSSASPPAAPSTVEVELARVGTTHDEKLILTTKDGAVWRQIDGGVVLPLPVAGDRMTVRRASMGSFLCEVRRNVGFRCSRSR